MTSPIYIALSPIIFPLFQRKITLLSGTEHLPKSGGYILACNHVDWLDGFYIVATVGKHRRVPTYFLSKSNNYWWTGITAKIPNDRSKIIESAVSQLHRGKVICNFPEGVRNTTLTLLPGKTGTVRMAAEAGVPVVPVGITCDAGRTMGQSLQFLFSKQHPVSLAFGEPLMFPKPQGGLTSEWLAQETQRLMIAIGHLALKTV